MAPGKSNGHVTLKGQGRDIEIYRYTDITVEDRGSAPMGHQEEVVYC